MQEWQEKHSHLQSKNNQLSGTVAEKEKDFMETIQEAQNLKTQLRWSIYTCIYV